MSKQRKTYSADFKAKVAIAAIKAQQTVNEIASTYGVHPNQVMTWKKQALESLPDTFSMRRERDAHSQEQLKAQLYQQIGQLKGGVGLAQKRSWTLRLRLSGGWSNPSINESVSGGSVNFWACTAQYSITSRKQSELRT